MIELHDDRLVFSFPEVHPQAKLTIELQRTLRIPDDGRSYPLPPGLGCFPLRHVDDFAANVPPEWLRRGGVMLPIYQAEALWLNFNPDHIHSRRAAYPFAIKVATGKQCAVSGGDWSDGLSRNPQNYMVAPTQPWLDGFVVEKGRIRQFVAMPLGAGYSAEEQITGKAEHGGIQLLVSPMKRDVFERRFPEIDEIQIRKRSAVVESYMAAGPDMGLAPGGLMKQEIYDDPFDLNDWEQSAKSRCFVHLCNSMVWRSITGSEPPYPPPTAKQYTQAGLPWFDYYDESATAIAPTKVLEELKSVATLSDEQRTVALPENESVTPEKVIEYRAKMQPHQVREGEF